MPQFNQTGGGIFVGEQLLAQPARIYEEHYPPLNADLLIPPSGSEDRGAAQYAREVYQSQGQADWVGDAADDLPQVNAGVIRDVYNIDMAGCSYGWSLKELNAAEFAKRPLDVRRGLAARRAIESFRNRLFFLGSAAKQIFGLFSFPYIPRSTLSIADFSPGADPEDTLQAMYSLSIDVITNSESAEKPTHLLLPTSIYLYVSSTRANLLNNDTILQVYMRNAPGAREVVEVRELETAGPTGGKVIAAITIGRDSAEHIVTNPLEILPPQERNLKTIFNVVTEVGGFVSEYPKAHAIGEF